MGSSWGRRGGGSSWRVNPVPCEAAVFLPRGGVLARGVSRVGRQQGPTRRAYLDAAVRLPRKGSGRGFLGDVVWAMPPGNTRLVDLQKK